MSTTSAIPEGDKFYYPEPSQLEGEHGEGIWSRPLTGEAALASARVNELVLYRSRDVYGKPIAVSGIIALPPTAPPEGGYPVVSWAHGTVGCAVTCAPSRDTRESPVHRSNKHPHALLNAFLDRGWAVVMTDYEGLGAEGLHPYPSGVHLLVAAGSTLDYAQGGFAFTALFLAGAIAGNPHTKVEELLTVKAQGVWEHIHTKSRIDLSKEDSWGGLKGTSNSTRAPTPARRHSSISSSS